MTLRVGEQSVRVGQMGPGFVVLAESFATRQTSGILHLTVDDVTEDIPIRLPNGIQSGNDWVETAEVESADFVTA